MPYYAAGYKEDDYKIKLYIMKVQEAARFLQLLPFIRRQTSALQEYGTGSYGFESVP